MFISEDGTVTGSVDVSRLDEVEPKSDEARAQLDALKAGRDAAQEQADRDAERLAEVHQAQSVAGQRRDAVTTQGDRYAVPATADQAGAQQTGAQQPGAQQDDADVARLQAEAEKAGVTVDKRWGADRLQQEIDAAKTARKGK